MTISRLIGTVPCAGDGGVACRLRGLRDPMKNGVARDCAGSVLVCPLFASEEGELAMKTRHWLISVGLALCVGGAFAQTTWKMTCTVSGSGAPETVGEGQNLWVGPATCMEEGGPLPGGVVTQNSIWEHVKGAGTLLSGDGVSRNPGGTYAYRTNSATMKTLMQDGKPVGWEASGTGVYTLGAGTAGSLKGKTVSWTARSTGPRTYVVDNKIE
jgi:hypothetical protein